jgi:hypothetical protein
MSASRSLLGRVCSTDLNLRATLHGHFIIKKAGSHHYSSYQGIDSGTMQLRNDHKLAVNWPFILLSRLVLPGSCEHLVASVHSWARLFAPRSPLPQSKTLHLLINRPAIRRCNFNHRIINTSLQNLPTTVNIHDGFLSPRKHPGRRG